MARKGRNIYKRKDGRWEGRIILGYDMDGKRRYHSVYGRNFGETKQKMQEYTEKYDLFLAGAQEKRLETVNLCKLSADRGRASASLLERDLSRSIEHGEGA